MIKHVIARKSEPGDFHIGEVRYDPKKKQIVIPVIAYISLWSSMTRLVRLPSNRRRWTVEAPFGLKLYAWKHKPKYRFYDTAHFGMTVHLRRAQ